jgi:hypothetical protein
MRLLKTTMPALFALALLAGLAAPVAAQDEGPLQIGDLDGIQRAVARGFTVDSVMAAAATPGAAPDGWFALGTMVLAFDSEDAAADAVLVLDDELTSSVGAEDSTTIDEIQLDVDLEHKAQLMTFEVEGVTATYLAVIARDGLHVDIVIGVTFGDDPEPVVTRTLTGMAEAQAGGGEGTFSEDGTSEGGLWDTLPDAETVAAELPALTEVEDEILYPVSSSPIATPAHLTVPVTGSTPAG